jgi:hypothetical protein
VQLKAFWVSDSVPVIGFATGELSAAEAHRMVDEKRVAAVRAQLAYTEAILNGEAASASRTGLKPSGTFFALA